MVGWTDNGVLWHFPINNEQGVEEKDVSFVNLEIIAKPVTEVHFYTSNDERRPFLSISFSAYAFLVNWSLKNFTAETFTLNNLLKH